LPTAEGAELLLEMLGEESEKRILSIGGAGTVNEFELYYRVHYRTKLAGNELWSNTQTVEARRDYTYSDANLLAKQGEEKRLYESMQQDVLSNLMRRLSSIKKIVACVLCV
jgi:LPS-assembly lipoprotein